MPNQTKSVPTKTLSTDQVAAKLGVARLHVWRLVEQGEIPSVVINGEKRINSADLPAVRSMFTATGVTTLEDFIAGRPRSASLTDEVSS